MPALGEALGLPKSSASSSVDSHSAEVGSRELGSLKHSVPKFRAKLKLFSIVEGALRGVYVHGWLHVGVPRTSYDDRRPYEEHSIFSLAGVKRGTN